MSVYHVQCVSVQYKDAIFAHECFNFTFQVGQVASPTDPHLVTWPMGL